MTEHMDDDFILRQSNYKYSDPKQARRAVLRSVSDEHNIPVVIRQLNLIKNTKSNSKARFRLESDVKFLKGLYKQNVSDLHTQTAGVDNADIPVFAVGGSEHPDFIFDMNYKKKFSTMDENILRMRKTCNCENNYRKYDRDYAKMIGGAGLDSSDDSVIELVDLPENKLQYAHTGLSHDAMYEKRTIANKEIIFRTIQNTDIDIDQILDLDLKYLDSDRTRLDVQNNIIENKTSGNIVSIESDGIIQGYCQLEPIDKSKIKIKWFCANKSYGTPLYMFMEKYLSIRGYEKIILSVSLEGSYNVRRLNFWNKMGFIAYEINAKINTVFMERVLH